MADLPKPATIEAELITDISELVDSFRGKDIKYDRSKAAREFFLNEVSPVCAYRKDYLVRGQGHPGTILAGIWSPHAEAGLYVRIGTECEGISLAQNHSFGQVLGWNYMWRGDCEEKGFLYLSDSSDDLPLQDLKKVYDLATKFTQALEGYHQIVLSRE